MKHKVLALWGVIFLVGCSETSVDRVSFVAPANPTGKEVDRPPRMVAIHAAYCPICVRMKPVVEDVVSQCDRKGVRVQLIDVTDEAGEKFLEEHHVDGLPTYIFINGKGREVARLVGAQPASTLRQALGVLNEEACPGVGRLPSPYRQEKENQLSCRSMNSGARAATRNSSSSKAPETMRRSDAPHAIRQRENCSRVSL